MKKNRTYYYIKFRVITLKNTSFIFKIPKNKYFGVKCSIPPTIASGRAGEMLELSWEEYSRFDRIYVYHSQ